MQNVLDKSIVEFYASKHLVEKKLSTNLILDLIKISLLPGTLCSETAQCKYWTWISDPYPSYIKWDIFKKCYLKDRSSGLRSKQGVISGAKNCQTAGMYYTIIKKEIVIPILFPRISFPFPHSLKGTT